MNILTDVWFFIGDICAYYCACIVSYIWYLLAHIWKWNNTHFDGKWKKGMKVSIHLDFTILWFVIWTFCSLFTGVHKWIFCVYCTIHWQQYTSTNVYYSHRNVLIRNSITATWIPIALCYYFIYRLNLSNIFHWEHSLVYLG